MMMICEIGSAWSLIRENYTITTMLDYRFVAGIAVEDTVVDRHLW